MTEKDTKRHIGKRERRRHISLLKVLRLILPTLLFFAMCVVMCVPLPSQAPVGESVGIETGMDVKDDAKDAPVVEIFSGTNVYDLERMDTVSFHMRHLDKMPEPTQRIKVNYFGNLRPFFNDSNYIHWEEAARYGIRPLTDTRSHWQIARPIVKVTTCADYFLDTLIYLSLIHI